MSDAMTRRGLMRRGSAATVATLGVGAGAHHSGRSPVGNAEAIGPLAIAGGAIAAGAIGYLAYKGAKSMLGNNDDMSGYTGASALHESIAAGAKEMQSADERVMTSIQNNITHSDNVALAKGKAAIIETMNAEKSESEAQTAMENAVDAYYATIQRNIITHWTSQYNQVNHHWTQIDNHADLSRQHTYLRAGNDGLDWWDDKVPIVVGQQTADNPTTYNDKEVTLLDGSTITYPTAKYELDTHGGNPNSYYAVTNDHLTPVNVPAYNQPGKIRVTDPNTDGGHIEYLIVEDYQAAWDALLTKRDDVYSQLSGFVSDVYAEYSAGDIPTEDIVDPITAATELDAGYDGYQTQAAHAAMMGIPTNAEQTLTLKIEGDEGGTSTVSADIYTNHVPTDGSGNEVGFQPGTRYEPSAWSEPLYISYSYTETDPETGEVTNEEQDFVQLENPFTVVEAYDKEGNEVSSFKPRARNNQTADVTKIEEELAQIREEQIAMQEEAEEEMNSGGGGGGGIVDDLIGGNPAVGAVVAVVAGGALLQIAKSFTE